MWNDRRWARRSTPGPGFLEMSSDGGGVDGLVHRDVVKLALGRGIVQRGEDRVDEVVDMAERSLARSTRSGDN
jgi:hypothetical protein